MVTDVNGCDTDTFVLSQCRNASVHTSILKGELFLLLIIYMLNFAQEINRAKLKFQLCCARHCFVQDNFKMLIMFIMTESPVNS